MAEGKKTLAEKFANTRKSKQDKYVTYKDIASSYGTTIQAAHTLISKYRRFGKDDIRTISSNNENEIALNLNDLIELFSKAIAARKSPSSRLNNRKPRMLPASVREIAVANQTEEPEYLTFEEIGKMYEIDAFTIRIYVNRFSKKNGINVERVKRENERVIRVNFNSVIEVFKIEARNRCSPDIIKIAETTKFPYSTFLTWKELSDHFEIPELSLRALKNQYEKKYEYHINNQTNENGLTILDVNSFIEMCRLASIDAGYPC